MTLDRPPGLPGPGVELAQVSTAFVFLHLLSWLCNLIPVTPELFFSPMSLFERDLQLFFRTDTQTHTPPELISARS